MRTLMSLFAAVALSTSAMAAEASGFTLTDIDNKKVSLADFQDQVVVMSFWATWCGPCKEEMPHLEKLYKENREKGFTVLSISTDDARSASRVKPFIKKNQYTFPVLLDRESKVISQYNPAKTLPYTVVIDRGEIVQTMSGFNPGDDEKVAALVLDLLAKKGAAPADAPAPAEAAEPAGKTE
ncbi:MAG: TlpA family protein disulfide reductase [Alphaproteobacteria bacterium]|nr:TlpA family protein disulfide reductase [Alphaproteobacteria bacterium]